MWIKHNFYSVDHPKTSMCLWAMMGKFVPSISKQSWTEGKTKMDSIVFEPLWSSTQFSVPFMYNTLCPCTNSLSRDLFPMQNCTIIVPSTPMTTLGSTSISLCCTQPSSMSSSIKIESDSDSEPDPPCWPHWPSSQRAEFTHWDES